VSGTLVRSARVDSSRRGVAAFIYHPWLRRLVCWLGQSRARQLAGWVDEVVPKGASLLDVGSGLGHVAYELRTRGHPTITVDPKYPPIVGGPHLLGNAQALPLADASCDVVLFCFVLHHVPSADHLPILREAKRVAKRQIVLLEDTFASNYERRRTMFFDSLFNLEFRGHPHANRASTDWLGLLSEAGLAPHLCWERKVAAFGIFPMRQALIAAEVQ
jgi:SAM-dependent methyltransferase